MFLKFTKSYNNFNFTNSKYYLGCAPKSDVELADPETITQNNCSCASRCKGFLPLYEHDFCFTGKKLRNLRNNYSTFVLL